MEIKFLILILAVINLSQVDSIAEGIHVEQSTSTFKDFLIFEDNTDFLKR